MAEFLQDTIEEIAITPKSKKPSKKLKDFADFVHTVSFRNLLKTKEIMFNKNQFPISFLSLGDSVETLLKKKTIFKCYPAKLLTNY